MGIQKTLGGDRLGAGQKRTEELPEFGRSTHNQSAHFRSSMAAGILYPCFRKFVDMNESIDIDISQDIRTLPTKGPLFGSFKTQIDLFAVDFRLYQGMLHNNPVNMGMKMNQVYLPKLVMSYNKTAPRLEGADDYDWQVNNSSLLKYLGLSGIGTPNWEQGYNKIKRKINAIPLLGYYDIFKNYYANKQEENAYVIVPEEITKDKELIHFHYAEIIMKRAGYNEGTYHKYQNSEQYITEFDYNYPEDYEDWEAPNELEYVEASFYTKETYDDLYNATSGEISKAILVPNEQEMTTLYQFIQNYPTVEFLAREGTQIEKEQGGNTYIKWKIPAVVVQNEGSGGYFFKTALKEIYQGEIKLSPFALENIDMMRNRILGSTEIGEEFQIGNAADLSSGYLWYESDGMNADGLPYSAVFKKTENEINYSSFAQAGLLLKTYQNDLFVNWIQTDWIEGENGIAQLSKVAVTDGSFEIDALLLSKAIYNMLIAVSISGGTYQDWNEARTGTKAVKQIETPIFIGGLTGEIMFEEVVSNAETNVGTEDYQPLGTLGGKGKVAFTKNGTNIHFRASEPCYVMGIVSITPRVNYHQGNEWDLTELDTMDDIHKAAFDRIGFQDLITEQMAWYDTKINSQTGELTRYSAGKVPAWSNYTTEVDRTYGDFAKASGKAYMVLNRNYVRDEDNGRISDLTTYIDPAKYNYAFAYTDLYANNFWADIYFHVETRRIMSAHNIPHA